MDERRTIDVLSSILTSVADALDALKHASGEPGRLVQFAPPDLLDLEHSVKERLDQTVMGIVQKHRVKCKECGREYFK